MVKNFLHNTFPQNKVNIFYGMLYIILVFLYFYLFSYLSIWDFFGIDDFYYYLSISKNSSSILHTSYDGIVETNGYQPLWMILIFIIMWISDLIAPHSLILPLVIILLTNLLIVLTFIYVLRSYLTFCTGNFLDNVATILFLLILFFAPTFILYHPAINFTSIIGSGLEFQLTLLCSTVFIIQLLKVKYINDPIRFSIWTTILMACRLDLVLFIFPIYSFILLRSSLGNILKLLFIPIATFGIYLVYNFNVYDSIIPVSGMIKNLWSTSGYATPAGDSLARLKDVVVINLGHIFLSKYDLQTVLVPLYFFIKVFIFLLLIIWAKPYFNKPSEIFKKFPFYSIFLGISFYYSYIIYIGFLETKYWYYSHIYVFCCFSFYLFLRKFLLVNHFNKTLIGIFLLLFINLIQLSFSKDNMLREIALKNEVLNYAKVSSTNTCRIGMADSGVAGYSSSYPLFNLDGLVADKAYYDALKNGRGRNYLLERNVCILILKDSYISLYPYSQVIAFNDSFIRRVNNSDYSIVQISKRD